MASGYTYLHVILPPTCPRQTYRLSTRTFKPLRLPRTVVKYADLPIIDLSKAATAEGRTELAAIVRDTMKTSGFMYVINHGYSPAQMKRIFDIANVPFDAVKNDEKQIYAGDIKATGSYQGYKLRKYWHIANGVHDQIENYNIHPDSDPKQHPEALRPFLPEIEAFLEHCHVNILHSILRLLALGLEMPEETLVNTHKYNAQTESWLRLMKYYPKSEEEEEKTENVWLKGHTDVGSVTILWSQPVAALQVRSPEGRWKWVRHIDNALVINIGDALEFLSGGLYKATIHRVVQPPPSQRGYTKLSVIYFAFLDNDVVLKPLEEIPVIMRQGPRPDRLPEQGKEPTMDEYRKARIRAYGQSEVKKGGGGVDTEYLEGILVKHYN
ncbi:Clavaminate synthase-like protein [Heliocybe sulcata]|uniref:Clavaminate synthase-like protein n=1 Tax=Heliocybe sulcata TaxID=5364 RepID=A0A5C3MM16_9AGAM|nr:Clavaminate synthase-like protein [Heliocybe sulcata]